MERLIAIRKYRLSYPVLHCIWLHISPDPSKTIAKEGWDDLVTPGVLCGVFGYVIGNFLGVSVYAVLS